jgi:integrase
MNGRFASAASQSGARTIGLHGLRHTHADRATGVGRMDAMVGHPKATEYPNPGDVARIRMYTYENKIENICRFSTVTSGPLWTVRVLSVS